MIGPPFGSKNNSSSLTKYKVQAPDALQSYDPMYSFSFVCVTIVSFFVGQIVSKWP